LSRIPLIGAILLLEVRLSGVVLPFGPRPSYVLLISCNLVVGDRINVEVPPDKGCAATRDHLSGSSFIVRS
jgi:hypothetical protein